MKTENFTLMRYDADEGMVFDWKEPRYNDVIENGKVVDKVQAHLYAKTLFIGKYDTIDNYIEVEAVTNEANENT